MPSKNDEKKAAELREKELAVGSYLALEGDDNAIDVSNAEYIGVDPIYKNSAYDLNAPKATSEKDDAEGAAIEQRAKDYEAEYSDLDVNRAGHTVGPHRAGAGVKVADVEEHAGEVLEEDAAPDADAYGVAADAAAAEQAKAEGQG